MGFGKIVKSFVKFVDFYGEPVTVNYKGSSQYQTKLGAFFSLITLGMVIGYSYTRFNNLYYRLNPNIS